MNLTQHEFGEGSNVSFSIFTCAIPSNPNSSCLIMEFKGDYGYGSGGNGDGIFMSAMIKAAAEIWEPNALVLDFRQLRYEWGDWMTNVILALDYKNELTGKWIRFPVAVVSSNLNNSALTSLASEEMDMEPKSLLFDSFEKALIAVSEKSPIQSP